MDSRGWDALAISAVFAAVAVIYAASLPVGYAFDPTKFVQFGFRYSETFAFFSSPHFDKSPPLRYAPYAILFAVFNPGTEASAFRIAATYAALVTFVGGALGSYALGSVLRGRRVAWMAVAAFVLTAFVWPGARFYPQGKWQYATTLPLLLGALAAAEASVNDDGLRLSVLAGVLLGLLGLQQLTYAGLGSLAIAVGYAWHREWKALVATGVAGAIVGSPLLFSQAEARSRAAGGIIGKFLPQQGPFFYPIPDLLGIALSVGVLAMLGVVALYVVVRMIDGRPSSQSGVAEAFIFFATIAWAASKLTLAQDYLAVTVRHPWVLVLVIGVAAHGLRNVWLAVQISESDSPPV